MASGNEARFENGDQARCEEAVVRRLWETWAEAEGMGVVFYCLKCVNIEILIESKIPIY